MARSKTESSSTGVRGEPLRQRIVDSAERLLREGKADFSMRELAAEARVSFATPFNQFGSKTAIMHALSRRRIDTMVRRFTEAPPLSDAVDRVLFAIDMAAAVMLEDPRVNRAMMGWIGMAGPSPGKILAHSGTLWMLALGDGKGLMAARREQALRSLPRQLAFAFRGVLSFWTAGELPDEALGPSTREMASTLLLGFAERQLSCDPNS
jgi:AcrR family transcriptional regulator